jgi:WD40 repeat protein
MAAIPSKCRAGTAIVMIAVCIFRSDSGSAADKPVTKSREAKPLSGLVPSPVSLPRIGRWQMARKVQRGRIYAVAWSPDGKRLAYGDMTYIRLCDAQTFKTQTILVGHSSRVTSLDWNRTNDRIASASFDGTVRLWSAEGVPEKVLTGHSGEVNAVMWSRDGKRIASAGSDGTLRIWKADGASLAVIAASDGPLNSVAWNPTGTQLVSGDDEHRVKIWNVEGTPGPVCEGHIAPITHVDWSSDGKNIASSTWALKPEDRVGRYFSDLRIWTAQGKGGPTIDNESENYGMRWSPDGSRVAIVSEGGSLRIWRPIDNALEQLNPQTAITLWEPPLAWSPNGEQIVLGGLSGLVVFDVATRATRSSRSSTQGDYLTSRYAFADWSPDGKYIAVVAQDKVQLWTPAGQPAAKLADKFIPRHGRGQIAWSPDGRRLTIVPRQGEVISVQTDGRPAKSSTAAATAGSHIAWSSQSGQLALADVNSITCTLRDGSTVKSDTCPGRIDSLRWIGEGKQLAVLHQLANDRSRFALRLYGSDMRLVSELKAIDGEVDSFDVSPDGKTAVIGYDLGHWELWDFSDRTGPKKSASAHMNGSCMDISFTPDGSHFITVGWDGIAHLWRNDGTRVRTFYGHTGPLNVASFHPDGQRFVTLGWDDTMRIWSRNSDLAQTTIFFVDRDHSLAITADGRIVRGEPDQIEEEFVFLIENESGSIDMINYSEFRQRTAPTAK